DVAVPGDPPDATAVPPRAVVGSTAVEPAPAPGPATDGFAVSAPPPNRGASAPDGAPAGVAVRRTPATTASAPPDVDGDAEVDVGVEVDVDDATASSARVAPAAASERSAPDPAAGVARADSRGSSAAASPGVNAFVTVVAPPDPERLPDASCVGAACLSGEGW